VFYSFVLCLLYLTFALAAAEFQAASISVGVGAKGLKHEDVMTTKSPSSQEPLADIEATPIDEASVLDIVLVLGQAGTVNHKVVAQGDI
jgi:hypothetical protein